MHSARTHDSAAFSFQGRQAIELANAPRTRLTLFSTMLAHPSFPFSIAWIMVLIMNQFSSDGPFSEFRGLIRIVAAGILTTNILGAVCMSFCYKRLNVVCLKRNSDCRFRFRRTLLALWLAISAVESYLSRGWPLFWVLHGSEKSYEDFGVHTLHGFANALWLYLTFSTFVIYYEKRRLTEAAIFIGLIAWTILTLSRASLTVIVFQTMFYYLLTTRQNFASLAVRFLAGVAVFILAFGFAGNLRVPEFSIAASVGRDKVSFLDDSVLWIYTYTVSPSANLAYNIANKKPSYAFPPTTFLGPLIPSQVRRALGEDIGFSGHPGSLANEAFNVGTGFWEIYLDLGIAGIAVYSFMIGAVGHVLWRSGTRVNRLPLITYYGVCAALSVFSNQFLQLPVIVNILLLGLLTGTRSARGEECGIHR